MLRLVFTILLGLALTAAQPQLRGVNYGIQLPDGSCGPYSQVLSDFQLIATFAQAVKIYNMGFCNGAENSIIAARATGLKLFLGMAAGPPDAFQNELSILTRLAGQYGFANIIGITVGSEDLYRQSVSASTIASYITQVKNVVKNNGGTVPVTHVDVYYLQPAEILAVSDIVMFNAFTFWEGQPIDNALATFISHYNSVVANANGKTVWIGETGWPANGATIGASVPSTTNAGTYVQQFICWANANGVPYFYFEAFDEPWKSPQDNGAIEASFGMYTSDRQKKDYFSFSCPNSNNQGGSSTTGNSAGSTATPSTSSSGNSNTCQKASFCSPTMCACGGACYDQSQYCCVSGQLTQFQFCPKTTPSTGASSTTGNSAGSSTTGNSAGSSTTGNSAGSSTTGSPTPTSSTTNCQTMFASLSCTTSSEDPSQVDSNSVNNARGWLCANYPQFCTDVNSGGKYSSCNSVEQISYAMSQYYNAYSSQGPSACSFGGLGHVTGKSGSSSTTGNSAGSSTTGNSAGSSTTVNSAGSSTTGNSAGSSTTGSATPTTSTGNSCQAMFASLKCRTKSEDPSQVDSNSVNNARGWLCANYPQYCTAINSGGQYSSCNSVEQISYGMNQYYNVYAAQQGTQACNFGGLGQVVSRK